MADLFDIAIARKLSGGGGGGGGNDFTEIEYSVFYDEQAYAYYLQIPSYNDLYAIVNGGKIPYYVITDADLTQIEATIGYNPFVYTPAVINKKFVLANMNNEEYIEAAFYPIGVVGWSTSAMYSAGDESSNLRVSI